MSKLNLTFLDPDYKVMTMEEAAISDYKKGTFKLESIRSYIPHETYQMFETQEIREKKLKELLDEEE